MTKLLSSLHGHMKRKQNLSIYELFAVLAVAGLSILLFAASPVLFLSLALVVQIYLILDYGKDFNRRILNVEAKVLQSIILFVGDVAHDLWFSKFNRRFRYWFEDKVNNAVCHWHLVVDWFKYYAGLIGNLFVGIVWIMTFGLFIEAYIYDRMETSNWFQLGVLVAIPLAYFVGHALATRLFQRLWSKSSVKISVLALAVLSLLAVFSNLSSTGMLLFALALICIVLSVNTLFLWNRLKKDRKENGGRHMQELSVKNVVTNRFNAIRRYRQNWDLHRDVIVAYLVFGASTMHESRINDQRTASAFKVMNDATRARDLALAPKHRKADTQLSLIAA